MINKKIIYYSLAILLLIGMGFIFSTNTVEAEINGTTVIVGESITHYSDIAFWLLINFSWIILLIPLIIPIIQLIRKKYWSSGFSLYFGLFMLFLLNIFAVINSSPSGNTEQFIETWQMICIILLTSLFSISGNIMGICIEQLVNKKELVVPDQQD